jgi:RsiW-degrading membrane proteinase PrsW (M82 family)
MVIDLKKALTISAGTWSAGWQYQAGPSGWFDCKAEKRNSKLSKIQYRINNIIVYLIIPLVLTVWWNLEATSVQKILQLSILKFCLNPKFDRSYISKKGTL